MSTESSAAVAALSNGHHAQLLGHLPSDPLTDITCLSH
jgi:hypothetical protein